MLFPFLTGFFFSLPDYLDLVAIRDMRIRKDGQEHVLDAVVTIRNTSQKTLKFSHCEFDLAMTVDPSHIIPLGKAAVKEILLVHEGSAPSTDTDLLLSLPLGSQQTMRALYDNIILTVPNIISPEIIQKIPLRMQARFASFAIKSAHAWNYGNGLTLDWVVTPEVETRVLAQFLQAISGGTSVSTSAPATPGARSEKK